MNNLFFIPANYTDAGKILGLFEIRNLIEAVLLSIPSFFICFSLLPFSLTYNIILTCIVVVPLGGFALIGIADESLSKYIFCLFKFYQRRQILLYRGYSKEEIR